MTREEFRLSRRLLQLTQAQLAEAMGISPRMIRNYESGAYPVPKVIGDWLRYACKAGILKKSDGDEAEAAD